jgi:DNA processing protein
MAEGVDAAAHVAALDANAATVAVVGTGTDVAYPRRHEKLAARIREHGAIVSEFLPGTEARPEHFPRRNRIIAGLALGTLVIEAAERSGALITARLAGEAGREVFAVPGSIHNPLARGCHRLIRQGAALVEDAREIIAALAPVAAELADALRSRLHEADPAAGPSATNGDRAQHRTWISAACSRPWGTTRRPSISSRNAQD